MPHRSNVYEKVAFGCENHLLFCDLRYDQYTSGLRQKSIKMSDLLYVFKCDATGIGRIANQRTGGDSSHRNATFSYTSRGSVINS